MNGATVAWISGSGRWTGAGGGIAIRGCPCAAVSRWHRRRNAHLRAKGYKQRKAFGEKTRVPCLRCLSSRFDSPSPAFLSRSVSALEGRRGWPVFFPLFSPSVFTTFLAIWLCVQSVKGISLETARPKAILFCLTPLPRRVHGLVSADSAHKYGGLRVPCKSDSSTANNP